jgi:uncharacterized protein YndB with AHSA1/START domain
MKEASSAGTMQPDGCTWYERIERRATDRLRVAVREEGTPPAVRREVVLPASRDEVWGALTDPGKLSAWFEAEVEIDPRPRGTVVARQHDGTVRAGTVLAANRPYRLVVIWGRSGENPEHEPGASRMEFTLEAVPDGTRLTVIEAPLSGSSAWDGFLLETAT